MNPQRYYADPHFAKNYHKAQVENDQIGDFHHNGAPLRVQDKHQENSDEAESKAKDQSTTPLHKRCL